MTQAIILALIVLACVTLAWGPPLLALLFLGGVAFALAGASKGWPSRPTRRR
jgi:hypothetical protein